MTEKELNIVLLGETGKGKSTWINAFANYCMFPTLQDAIDKGGYFPIPMQVCVEGKDKKLHTLATHQDEIPECQVGEQGHTETREPTLYSFRHSSGLHINLVDTAGYLDIANPRNPGVLTAKIVTQSDKQHAQNAMKIFSCLSKLDAIFVFLKATDSGINFNFQRTLGKIFRRLQATASTNVIFILTCSGSVNFDSIKMIPVISTFVRSNNLKIPLPPVIYCFDNDAVLYILEEKNEILHDHVDSQRANTNWDNSVKATQDVLRRVSTYLVPHSLSYAADVHMANLLCDILAEVALSAVECIVKREMEFEEKLKHLKEQLENCDKRLPVECEIDKVLQVQEEIVTVKTLGHWNVVCESEHCIRVAGGNVVPKICCEKCQAMVMFLCSKMELFGRCRFCGCSSSWHTWTRREVKSVKREPSRQRVKQNKKIAKITDKKQQLTAAFNDIESRLMETPGEKEMFLTTCARMSIFRQMHAPQSCNAQNDPFIVQITKKMNAHRIAVAVKRNRDTQKRIEKLQKIESDYKQCLQNAKPPQSLNEVMEEMYRLPVEGDSLRRCIDEHIAAQRTARDQIELNRMEIDLPDNCPLLSFLLI